MNMEISLLQLNLQKSRVATAELNRWSYDIGLVQEPYITKNDRINLVQHPKSYVSKGNARAAIIFNGPIDYWPVD